MRQSRNDFVNAGSSADPARTSVDWRGQADRPSSRKKKVLPLYIGVGIMAALALIGAAAGLSKSFRHQLAISIVRQPTPYTQLYFPQPGALPERLKIDQKNTFIFTIVNDESRTYSYAYTVTLSDSRSHSVVSAEDITIDDAGSVTRSVAVLPKDRKAKYLITVALKGMNQSIHFYGETS